MSATRLFETVRPCLKYVLLSMTRPIWLRKKLNIAYCSCIALEDNEGNVVTVEDVLKFILSEAVSYVEGYYTFIFPEGPLLCSRESWRCDTVSRRLLC